MIELKDVHQSYRTGFMRRLTPVLKGISFEVGAETVVGYLGINGAGKTTTIKLITGINQASSGAITIDGEPTTEAEARALIGYLPENPYFYEYLSPREALDLYGRLQGLPRQERRRRAEELLERVRLKGDAERPLRGFSKGMRQRLGLAQAILHDPKYLILDEPLTGLDPMGRLLLRDIILEERRAGRTVFFSSHILSDVEAISNELVILDGGAIAYKGPVSELLASFRGKGVRLRFRLTGAEDLPEALAALPWEEAPSPRSEGWEGRLPSSEAGQEAIDAIRAAGGLVLDFRSLDISLEDYFLKRFGGVHHQDAAAQNPKEATS